MNRSRLAFVALALLLSTSPLPAQSGNTAAGSPKYWENLTRNALSDPSTPKFASDLARARWVMGVVERELIRQNIRPNTSLAGRAVSGVTTGDLTTGACGHIAILMRSAFKGAGFDSSRIFTVIGQAEGVGSMNPLWVNSNHAAVGLVLGNQLVMFDPWEHAYANGGWSGMQGSPWNGMSFPRWVTNIDDYESFVWENENAANLDDQTPLSVQKDILDWSARLGEAAARKKAGTKQSPAQETSAGAAPSTAHWRLIGAPKMEKEWNQPPIAGYFQDFNTSAGTGSISLDYHCGDSQHMMEDRSQNRATFNWNTSESLQYLVPGRKLVTTGTLTHKSDGFAGAQAAAHTRDGVHLAHLVKPVTASNASVATRGEWEIPAGGRPLPGLELEFNCSNSGGIVRLKYLYEWVSGGTPQKAAPAAGDRWNGRWKSQWGDMVFEAGPGREVRGTFAHKGGRFEGSISPDGNSVRGTWTQEPTRQPPRDAGAFLFQLASDFQSFTGSYWYGMDSAGPPAGPWSASR